MADNPQDQFPGDATKIPIADMTNNPDMSADRANKVVTEHAAYGADVTVAGTVGKIQTPSGAVFGVFAYPNKATTNASGVATIYLTSDGTASGSAVFSTVYEDGIIAMPVGTTSNYQVTGIVLAGNKKSIAVSVNQLGSVVLGLVNVTTAAAGVEVRAIVLGK